MKLKYRFSLFVLILISLAVNRVAYAQDGNPPQDDSWSEVIDADGNILYSNLTDLGEVQGKVEWMPDLPFLDGRATFHEYLTPSGNIVLLPSATTLFFMALNPEASGLNGAYGALGNGIGVLETMLAGYITPQDLADYGYAGADAFWQAVINGDVNFWTIDIMGDFLLDLLSSSLVDGNLYTMLLLYQQGNCDAIPGGCPEVPRPTPTPTAGTCPAAYIQTALIQADGEKTAPPHPVVIGQDPERRGVDVRVKVLIPPVIYHTFRAIRREDQVCAWDNSGTSSGCPEHPGDPYWQTEVNVWYECQEHTSTFPDYLASARISVSLTAHSRSWILNDLAQAYPGAHLIHPDFAFSFPGPGSLLGNQSVTWATTIPRIQTADPGEFETAVTVRTTGTPVSAPRQVQVSLGTFSVELVEVILIEEP